MAGNELAHPHGDRGREQVTRKMGQSPPNSRLKAPQESPTMGTTSQG